MRQTSVSNRLSIALVLFVCVCAAAAANAAESLKPEEIIQKHLDSIGTSSVRETAKSRVVESTNSYKLLVGGNGQIQGSSVMVSEGNNLQLLLKINASRYHGERFTRSGDKTFVEGTYDDKSRSEFGQFLRGEDLPLREGLLGGTLSSGWPLLDVNTTKSKLHYLGTKKVDGRELHAFEYRPKKSSGLEITLYFDPETFQHVLTIYKASVHAGIGGSNLDAGMTADPISGGLTGGAETESARKQQTRYRIEERFSDFKQYDGFTLPSHYDLRFTGEYSNGFTKTVDWDMTATRVLNNVTLDPKNFIIH
jgi:hypothetical protein